MQLGESLSLLGSFLRLTFVENPGMAFGIEVQHRPLLVLVTVLLLLQLHGISTAFGMNVFSTGCRLL